MNEFRVGLLALATMAAVVYMSIKVTSNQSGFGEYVSYRTIVEDASGIFPKTPIKVAGINAGRINSIELQGNSALITFEILKRVKITEGSRLKVKTVGFLGDKYLEINVGDSGVQLSSKAFLESEIGGGIEDLAKDAVEVLKDVKKITEGLRKSLAPVNGVSPLKAILDNMKEATAAMNRVMNNNEDKINKMITNFKNLSQSLQDEFDRKNEKSTLVALKKLLDNAKQATADMATIMANLKKGKGTMGKLLVEEEIADQITETMAGVQKIVNKVDAIRTELSFFSGSNTVSGSETQADLLIFPAPERFYQLGLATSRFGPESEKLTETEVNGEVTSELERTRQKDTYRFNVQVGRRLHDWSFRGGLIETSGGLGVDYDFNKSGARMTFEVFDYRENLGPNYRLGTQIRLWNVFYGKLYGEDLAANPSATIQAGFRFNDEDLKGLIGFFL